MIFRINKSAFHAWLPAIQLCIQKVSFLFNFFMCCIVRYWCCLGRWASRWRSLGCWSNELKSWGLEGAVSCALFFFHFEYWLAFYGQVNVDFRWKYCLHRSFLYCTMHLHWKSFRQLVRPVYSSSCTIQPLIPKRRCCHPNSRSKIERCGVVWVRCWSLTKSTLALL